MNAEKQVKAPLLPAMLSTALLAGFYLSQQDLSTQSWIQTLLYIGQVALNWVILIALEQYRKKTKKRNPFSFYGIALLVAIMFICGSYFLVQMWGNGLPFALGSILSFGVVCVLYELHHSIYRTKKVLSDLNKVRLEDAENKLYQLKQQLNPHFLFNALNVLKALIHIDQEKAVQYTVDLAELLRITVDSDKKEITLQEELEICNLFLNIQNIRFSDNIVFETDLPYMALNKKIPFLTLLILLENAIKHNIITSTNKLFIHLSVENQYLVVKNNSTQKKNYENRNGIGLKNIENRYLLYYQQHILVKELPNAFLVKIPLNP